MVNIRPFPETSPNVDCYWEKKCGADFILNMGLSLKSLTLNRSEAKSLRDVLDKFLKEAK